MTIRISYIFGKYVHVHNPNKLKLHARCGGNQDVRFNGALVLSRHRTIGSIPKTTLDRFKANVAARGYDPPEDFCTFDNTECTECTNY